MKKTFLLMGIAALAFASCAKDTVSEINYGRAIDFRVATQTRATETTVNNLTEFKVTAISATIDETEDVWTENKPYFTDVLFKNTEANKTDYNSENKYYWPEAGGLKFYAYAPAGTANVKIDKDTKTITDFTPNENIKSQVDLIVGKGKGTNANQSEGVPLTFDHMLSQIEIKAKNTDANHTFKVAGFRISNVLPTGTLDFSGTNPSWTASGTADTYEVLYNKSGYTNCITLSANSQVITAYYDETNTTFVTDNAMLIPQDLSEADSKLEVLVNVTSTTGVQIFPATAGAYDWMEVGISTNWAAGTKYTYTLDLTNSLGAPIKFTTAFTPWATEYPSDLTPTPVVEEKGNDVE